MITGGIDIQAGSIVGLTSIIIGVAWQDWGMNIWAAVVLCNCDRYLMWNADWIFYRILWRTGDGRNIRWKFLICRTCPDGFHFE